MDKPAFQLKLIGNAIEQLRRIDCLLLNIEDIELIVLLVLLIIFFCFILEEETAINAKVATSINSYRLKTKFCHNPQDQVY